MEPILLRRTWRELAEYLNDKPDSLRIVQIVNRLSPRSWTFRFSFSAGGRTDLVLESTPSLTSRDLAALLDGFLEEMFFAERVVARSDGRCASVPIESLLANPPNHNKLEFDTTDEAGRPVLKLIGFGRSSQMAAALQHPERVQSAFSEGTWLGTEKHAGNDASVVQWDVYGNSRELQLQSRLSRVLGGSDSLRRDLTLFDVDGQHLGSAVAATTPTLRQTTVCTEFGEIDARFLTDVVGPHPRGHWFAEVNVRSLTTDYWTVADRSRLIREVVQSVNSALETLEHSDAFADYAVRLAQQDKRRRATELGLRQNRAKHSCRLEWQGITLLTEPRCENEVVVLLSKLEILGAIPFHGFTLVEYTAKRGIDALAHYQIMPEDVPVNFGAVEIEYEFENFFRHEHPIEQANLVICWDFGDPPEDDPRLTRRKDWLYQFQEQDYGFCVVPLKRIPGIVRKEGAA